MQISWITKGLRTGVLTTRYPKVREPMPPGFRGQLTLNAALCRNAANCGACVVVCLPRALTLNRAEDGRPSCLRLNLGACITCGLCVDACPSKALTFGSEYELAAPQLNDLRTDLTFDFEREREDDGH